MNPIGRWMRRIRESLFLIPAVVIVLCAGAAGASLLIDANAADTLDRLPVVLSATVNGGRAIATTVAGATITVAAIVFSITALSTQMAASQYSPRAMGSFFENAFQQVIIGLVVGTFTYSLLILAGLSDVLDTPDGAVPSLSVTLAIVLGVASALGIVAYIDHSLRRMQIDSVVRRIAGAALDAVRRSHALRDERGEMPESGQPEGESLKLEASRSGWIVSIDGPQLASVIPPRSTARVDVRVGEAVAKGDRIVTIWPDPGEAPDLLRRIRRVIRVAPKRSLGGDPEFGIRQLVDISLRALSPGINDPSTAVDVIHHLKIPIREILLSDPPVRVYNGSQDRRVVLAATPSRSDFVHTAFSEIRLAATDQPYVLRALIEVLEDLATELRAKDLEGRLGAIEEELNLTVEAVKTSDLPDPDVKRVLETRRLVGPEEGG